MTRAPHGDLGSSAHSIICQRRGLYYQLLKTARFVDGFCRIAIQNLRHHGAKALMNHLKVLNRRLTGTSDQGISNLAEYALRITIVDIHIGSSEIA
jgi:hypothetical protein